MGKYNHLKKFVEGGSYTDARIQKLSERYNLQYDSSISSFDILFNSNRADTVYRNGISYRCLVDFGGVLKKGEFNNNLYRKEIRTKHSDNFNGGDVVEFENKISKEKQIYLLLKTIETKEGYDLSIMQLCNSTYTLKGEPTKTLIGYDDAGRPVENITQGVDTQVPCIVENKVLVGDSNQVINLPDGRVQVTMTYREHAELQIDKVFDMYGDKYKIVNIDKTKVMNGVGLLVITGQRTV